MPDIAYVNGMFVSHENAKVSIDDRAVQFGESVYEVVPAYGGVPFLLQPHIARLNDGLSFLDIPYDSSELVSNIDEGIDLAGYKNTLIYIQVSRGAARRTHNRPTDLEPTVLATFTELTPHDYSAGISVMTTPDQRWGNCHIKTTQLLANILAKHYGAQYGCEEVLLTRENNMIVEGTSSNVFMVRDNYLITPPRDANILPGITRHAVLEIAHESGMHIEERLISMMELEQAAEMFVTSSTKDIAPIKKVNSYEIPLGPIAPHLLKKLQALR